jgi:acetyltransferase-like isoleucine patch superfamily enzyme
LIGDGVVIREKVEIGDNTVIGINCKVGTRTKIGSKTRIMDLTNVASDAIIEDNVFVGMGVMMGNDNKMGRTDDWVAEGPVIKEWSTIGMNASILPGVIIGNDVIVGAGSVVTKDVLEKIVVMGIPAKFKRNLTQEEIRSE